MIQATPQILIESSDYHSNLEKWKLEANQLQSKCEILEHEKATLVKDFEEEISYSLDLKSKLETTIDKLKSATDNFDDLEANMKKLQQEKKLLEKKHQIVSAESKTSKTQINDLEKDIRGTSVALKSSKKDLKEEALRHEKTVINLKKKIEDLEKFKARKSLEEKEIKVKEKKLNKKLKNVSDIEAKLEFLKAKTSERPTLNDINENEPICNDDVATSQQVDVIENVMEDANNGNCPEVTKPNIEDTWIKIKSKLQLKMKSAIHEKVEARAGVDIFSEEEKIDLEEELLNEMEITVAKDLETWRQNLESELVVSGDSTEEVDQDEPFDDQDHGFYWGGEEELVMMFRSIDS